MSSPTDPRVALAAAIAKLRDDYLARLPAELADLTQLAAGLNGAESDRTTLDDLHRRLHKLAGSGGTFGVSLLGERARQLEQTAKAWLGASLESIDCRALRTFAADVAALHGTLAQADAAPTTAALAGGATGETEPIVHLWLVDNDAQQAIAVAHSLGQFGYDVRPFSRIGDAMSAAATAPPQAVIVDLAFADDADTGTPALSQAFQTLDCPLLIVSDQGDFHARARAARLGATGFLVKPLDVPSLAERLERIFEAHRAIPFRVLIVDDDVSLSTHFRLVLLAAGMEAEVLNRPQDIIERVVAFRPDLILLDINMPDYSGLELATVIRHHDAWIGLPIVYLSAETDLDKQLLAMGRGADDFITKPIADAQLVAAVQVRAARSRQLADLMSKDSLTALLKHARIKEEIDIEFARIRRTGKPMSVAMLDIDHFKSVNDSYGHAVGDRVIKAVAHLLRQRLRKSDAIGRYGGEEFLAMLAECDMDTARRVMEDIRSRFAALRFQHEGQEFACTLSVGVASTEGHPPETGNALIVAADTALYAAKHGGRNQVRIFDPASAQS